MQSEREHGAHMVDYPLAYTYAPCSLSDRIMGRSLIKTNRNKLATIPTSLIDRKLFKWERNERNALAKKKAYRIPSQSVSEKVLQ